jgi:hypothetical protein
MRLASVVGNARLCGRAVLAVLVSSRYLRRTGRDGKTCEDYTRERRERVACLRTK